MAAQAALQWYRSIHFRGENSRLICAAELCKIGYDLYIPITMSACLLVGFVGTIA